MRTEGPSNDLKYDMRVLSDQIEFFFLLGGRGDDQVSAALSGSLWAWDGNNLNVRSSSFTC